MVLAPDVGWIGLSVALCLKQFVSRLWIYSKLSKLVELYFEIKYTDLKLHRFEKLNESVKVKVAQSCLTL